MARKWNTVCWLPISEQTRGGLAVRGRPGASELFSRRNPLSFVPSLVNQHIDPKSAGSCSGFPFIYPIFNVLVRAAMGQIVVAGHQCGVYNPPDRCSD